MTALGIFLLSSLFFVLIGMAEFAVLLFLLRRSENSLSSQNTLQLSNNTTCISSTLDYVEDRKGVNGHVNNSNHSRRASKFIFYSTKIDFYATILFPILYGMFNVCYWVLYMKWMSSFYEYTRFHFESNPTIEITKSNFTIVNQFIVTITDILNLERKFGAVIRNSSNIGIEWTPEIKVTIMKKSFTNSRHFSTWWLPRSNDFSCWIYFNNETLDIRFQIWSHKFTVADMMN